MRIKKSDHIDHPVFSFPSKNPFLSVLILPWAIGEYKSNIIRKKIDVVILSTIKHPPLQNENGLNLSINMHENIKGYKNIVILTNFIEK